MSYRAPLVQTIVASGTTVSSPFALLGHPNPGLVWPASLDGNLYLQVTHQPTNPTSASFVRLQTNPASTFWVDWAVTSPAQNAGGAIPVPELNPFPHARLESGIAVTNTLSFTIVGKSL